LDIDYDAFIVKFGWENTIRLSLTREYINAITPFEITEIEAKQYLETEIQQGLEDVKIPLTEITHIGSYNLRV
jgi:hypothetical protein